MYVCVNSCVAHIAIGIQIFQWNWSLSIYSDSHWHISPLVSRYSSEIDHYQSIVIAIDRVSSDFFRMHWINIDNFIAEGEFLVKIRARTEYLFW